MSKIAYSEEDVKQKIITPTLEKVGWDLRHQIWFERSFTDGQVIVRGKVVKRGPKKLADYILNYTPNFPIALIEVKKPSIPLESGMQQALDYAKILDIPFVYSSNGSGFVEHNRLQGTERRLSLSEFPSPETLFSLYKQQISLSTLQEKILKAPYYYAEGSKTPRYYQRIAINRTSSAIAAGQQRLLLVMATGTGKTFTAFQIIHKLWKLGIKKKILFLADRNILIDQTMQNDFKPFEKVMVKVGQKKLDSAYEIYMSLYHQLAGDDQTTEVFKQFQPGFFDLIIVDECHRGSAKENSNWRAILEYFKDATQIGLTATPKETEDISTQTYFGAPIYTYSLKQGIEDGFLAPYKVTRITLNISDGYRPEAGKLDASNIPVPDREYNEKDYDRNIVIDERTKVVASKITEFLKNTDRFAKTIVFCVDIEHAARMRCALINENSDMVAQNGKYVMKITGDDQQGKLELDNFIDEDEKYPTIVTTSQLLSTGVDCQTCKVIVLDKNIESMTEFKQIIGRGTRLKPEYGKEYFTILDFRNATRKFADKDFDGDPVIVYEPKVTEPMVPVEEEVVVDTAEEEQGSSAHDIQITPHGIILPEESGESKKIYVDGVPVFVTYERVQYYGTDGKLITENLINYTKRNIKQQFATLNDFLNQWNQEDKKTAIIENLESHGILLGSLRTETENKDLDDFDLICHLAFDKKPLTKAERAKNVRKREYLHKYSAVAQKVLNALLDHYMDDGIRDLEGENATKVLVSIDSLRKIASPTKIINAFGGRDAYLQAVKELQNQIYSA